MTFDPHPMEVVFPGSHPAQLTTLTRRAELVEEMGIDVFLVMPFTSDFMKLTPERYVHELLVENLHVVEVVVGENFTFGKKAAGNVNLLRKAGERFGFAVEGMSLVAEHHARRNRHLLLHLHPVLRRRRRRGRGRRGAGQAAPRRGRGGPRRRARQGAGLSDGKCGAADVLGHPGRRRLCGVVHRARPRTRSSGTVVPGERYQAAVSVGTNPTFSGRTRTVEAFVLDTTADLYGQHVAVDFVARIRGQEKFAKVEDLVTAMGDDTDRARTILSAQ